MKQGDIKFRAWDLDEKKWIPFDAIFFTEKGAMELIQFRGGKTIHLLIYGIGTGELQGSPAQNIELMQFTGLLDKNGKEIYEGDILELKGKTKDWVAKVYWDHCEWDFESIRTFIDPILKDRNFWLPFRTTAEDMEVIGNVWENPELLEETK